ncbi:MAG: hypothetical protein ACREUY_10720 [Burkholderiales bacterium]
MRIRTALKFSPAQQLARAANVRPKSIGVGNRVYGIPGVPGGLKLGNMPAELSDYINTPGTPGSSTFYMYGLGQEDVTSDSPSFWDSVNSVLKTTAEAAKTIVPAVLQAQQARAAANALEAGRITPAQYQQVVTQPVATVAIAPSAGMVRGLGISGGVLALVAAGAAAFLLLRRKRR